MLRLKILIIDLVLFTQCFSLENKEQCEKFRDEWPKAVKEKIDCTENKNAAETLSFELKIEDDKNNVPDDAKRSLGLYEYIGRLKHEDKIHPIYRWIGEKNKPATHHMYLINEWESLQTGFKGWIGAQDLKSAAFRQQTTWLKTDDCEKKAPHECTWKLLKKIGDQNDGYEVEIKEYSEGGLGIGTIIGIVIGAVLVIGIIAAAGVFVYKKKPSKGRTNLGGGVDPNGSHM